MPPFARRVVRGVHVRLARVCTRSECISSKFSKGLLPCPRFLTLLYRPGEFLQGTDSQVHLDGAGVQVIGGNYDSWSSPPQPCLTKSPHPSLSAPKQGSLDKEVSRKEFSDRQSCGLLRLRLNIGQRRRGSRCARTPLSRTGIFLCFRTSWRLSVGRKALTKKNKPNKTPPFARDPQLSVIGERRKRYPREP